MNLERLIPPSKYRKSGNTQPTGKSKANGIIGDETDQHPGFKIEGFPGPIDSIYATHEPRAKYNLPEESTAANKASQSSRERKLFASSRSTLR